MSSTITFRIDTELKKEFKKYAINQNTNLSELLIKWITEHLENEIIKE